MGRAGDRIFVYARGRGKAPDNKVRVIRRRCGRNHQFPQPVAFHEFQVGPGVGNLGFTVGQGNLPVVEALVHFHRLKPHALLKTRGDAHFLDGVGGKIHDNPCLGFPYGQLAPGGREFQGLMALF